MAKSRASNKPTVAAILQRMQTPRFSFTPEQREQVAAALEHNDSTPNAKQRISAAALCELLREHYGWARESRALERAACREFGRRSWGCK